MKRRSLLFWTTLIALLLWRVPCLSAEEYRWVDSSEAIHYSPVRNMIITVASRQGVDPALVEAVIAIESDFNPRAISPKGAIGLMQLMPQTASRYGVSDPFDPQENLTGGIRYLRDLLRRFGGDLPQVLAAYNAGEAAVLMHRGVPPYRETREYVHKVIGRYRPGQVPQSFSSAPSIGRRASGVAQVREEESEHFRFPGVSRSETSPASSRINSARTTRLMRAAAHRPLTKMFRAPLVRTRKARTIFVTFRVYRYRGPREFPTYSNFPRVSSLR